MLLLIKEPYGTLERQQATIAEVERLYPEPTSYLSYSSYVPHYPRHIPGLISGVGLDRYWKERSGKFAQDIEAGEIPFLIVTGDALDLVFNGDGTLQILPDQDVQALKSNFLKHSDTIYILGRNICPEEQPQNLPIYRSGQYTVTGGDLVINSNPVLDNQTISLQAGNHEVRNVQNSCVKLWAFDQAPRLPKDFPEGPIAGGF